MRWVEAAERAGRCCSHRYHSWSGGPGQAGLTDSMPGSSHEWTDQNKLPSFDQVMELPALTEATISTDCIDADGRMNIRRYLQLGRVGR